ncbi:uncharacterized protein LOC108165603 isoform X1 [Drosophila miranda]|uniref:uncharacterized protein LOC108165603 isoform X1 n=2 Tax=Drosophila miranda TaxID=7229 RepID=UPI00143F60FB|nr:uncharacterized protein LOC108165603 isoform X1 [Drosophila miranda]
MKDQPIKEQRDYLKIVCYAIAAFEALHSLYFLLDTAYLLISYTNLYTIMAFLGTNVWVLTVVALSVGLWKERPMLFIFWFFFSGIGTVTDMVYMVWDVTASLTFDLAHFLRWTILYCGIALECTGLYLVYSYYQRLNRQENDDSASRPKRRKRDVPKSPALQSETTSYPATDTKR